MGVIKKEMIGTKLEQRLIENLQQIFIRTTMSVSPLREKRLTWKYFQTLPRAIYEYLYSLSMNTPINNRVTNNSLFRELCQSECNFSCAHLANQMHYTLWTWSIRLPFNLLFALFCGIRRQTDMIDGYLKDIVNEILISSP